MELFEIACRDKYRYASVAGLLTTEDLWDLPLTSRNNASLDGVAKAVHTTLSEKQTESFVPAENSDGSANQLENMLAIVKHVIAARVEERDNAKLAKARAARKEKLLEVLEKKQDASLENMSEEELKSELEAL